MTLQEIRRRVVEGADARFGETIEKVMGTLLNRHTHQCWQRECDCEYCQFINGEYVNAKMLLHKLKKRTRYYDRIWHLTESEMHCMMSNGMLENHAKWQVKLLKAHKKVLQGNIV